jgi:hypothetical protein
LGRADGSEGDPHAECVLEVCNGRLGGFSILGLNPEAQAIRFLVHADLEELDWCEGRPCRPCILGGLLQTRQRVSRQLDLDPSGRCGCELADPLLYRRIALRQEDHEAAVLGRQVVGPAVRIERLGVREHTVAGIRHEAHSPRKVELALLLGGENDAPHVRADIQSRVDDG